MKKFYLSLFTFLFLIQISKSQLILTQTANQIIIGDTNKTYLVDTGLVNIKTVNAISGNNVIWNFSNLSILGNSITTSVYTSTTAVSSATNYPGCNIVQSNSNYFKSVVTPSAQTELLGTAVSIVGLNFSNSAIVAKYPFTFSNTFTDNYSGTVTFTTNGTFTGNVSVIADGNGTLNLPNGQVFINVLRVKSVQSTTVTGIIPALPLPINVKITNYDYYHSSQKYPIFNVNYTSFAIPFTTPTVSARISANTKSTIVGLKENSLLNESVALFPNPTNSNLNITINSALNPKQILIYNHFGAIVYQTNYNSQINVSTLVEGIYFITIDTDKGIIRKKLVKQ